MASGASSAKLPARASEFLRTRWHLRQRSKPGASSESGRERDDAVSSSSAPSSAPSRNSQFRSIRPPPSVFALLERHGLGRMKPKDRFLQRNERRTARTGLPPLSARDRLFTQPPPQFVASARAVQSFLPPSLPEVAVVGRSNVGKSSLINALTCTRLAKTSPLPGYTRSVNWFELRGRARLVDLPGYGFAFSDEERRAEWRALIDSYLGSRRDAKPTSLRRVCVLVDSRVGLKTSDTEMLNLLDQYKIPFHVVLTKCDLVDRTDLARRYVLCEEAAKSRETFVQPLMGCSARDGAGLSWLRSALASSLPLKLTRAAADDDDAAASQTKRQRRRK